MFQSTPLREGRLAALVTAFIYLCFNPRPSVRGDNTGHLIAERSARFNPRPSVRGDAKYAPIAAPIFLFQSTPLREGRPNHLHTFGFCFFVSIHAPP